ncbi:hypothetical protein [Actinomyces qiguomingii]|nr:hypothetical protein [Actinomyces qiguomingii]
MSPKWHEPDAKADGTGSVGVELTSVTTGELLDEGAVAGLG